MSVRILSFVFSALTAFAQQQPANPTPGCRATAAEIEANKKVVIAFFTPGVDRVALADPSYKQHNPAFKKRAENAHVSDYEEYKSAFSQGRGEGGPPPGNGPKPPAPNLLEVVTAECDVVTVIHKLYRPDPNAAPGTFYEFFTFDTFRVKNGKLVEHWDGSMIQPMMGRRPMASLDTPLLVDVDWLAQHLNDRDLVLLHVGPRPEFDARHIPGARFIALADISLPSSKDNPKQLTLEMPPAADLRAKLASLGISDDSRIVVYTGSEGTFQSATRVVLTLDYLGLGDRASLLNGGLAAWTGAGKRVTGEVASATPGTLTARPTKDLIVDAAFVKSIGEHAGFRLVDARLPNFYSGADATYEKKGHIPGAINIPFSELLDGAQKVDRMRVEEVFRKAGIKPGDTVVAYCHIGQQATAVIFGARLLGNPVKLYDGSFQDWAVNDRGPVEK